MAIRQILTQDSEHKARLHTPTRLVTSFDDNLDDLIEDMWDSMYAFRGVGLAATQIGSNLRVCVIDTIQRASSKRNLVMVNPQILSFSGEIVEEEGCLSMPGLRWDIPRAKEVRVEFQDAAGRIQQLRGKGLLARAIQHECDHLDGLLCNSRAPEGQPPRDLNEQARKILMIGK